MSTAPLVVPSQEAALEEGERVEEDSGGPDVDEADEADEDAPAEPPRAWTEAAIFATSFAFCFSMREGMLMLSAMQLLVAGFMLYSHRELYGARDDVPPVLLVPLVLLCFNAAIGGIACRLSSERAALVLVLTFGALLASLASLFGGSHPTSCSNEVVDDETPLGLLITRLLWTADACLLMTILGWVTSAAAAAFSFYLWYMVICFWHLLHASGADARRLSRAIASLPIRKHRCGGTAGGGGDGEGGEGDGGGESCAICLGDFEEGEEVRMLPCMHEFCRECIDSWIMRQGLSASCPLCKRRLLTRTPGRPERSDSPPPPPPAAADERDDEEGAFVPFVAGGEPWAEGGADEPAAAPAPPAAELQAAAEQLVAAAMPPAPAEAAEVAVPEAAAAESAEEEEAA